MTAGQYLGWVVRSLLAFAVLLFLASCAAAQRTTLDPYEMEARAMIYEMLLTGMRESPVGL